MYITFTFSSTVEVIITPFLVGREVFESATEKTELYISIKHYNERVSIECDEKRNGILRSYKFSAGVHQRFPPEHCYFDLNAYKVEELTKTTETNYPLILKMVSSLKTNLKLVGNVDNESG